MESRDRRLTDIESRVADACGVLNVAHAELVALTAELIQTELWRGYGIRSVEHWLTLKAGLSPSRAHQIVQVAAATEQLPVTTGSLATGELSFEQVHAVAQHPGKFDDAKAASFAKIATVTQLRRTLSRYNFDDDPSQRPGSAPETPDGATDTSRTGDGQPVVDTNATGEDQPVHDRDTAVSEAMAPGRLVQFHDGNRYTLHVDAPADTGALIEAALKEAKDALFQTGHTSVTWLDALEEVCNRSLSAAEPSGRRDKYRVYVHLDTRGAWVNAGPALPTSMFTKLSCDGSIAPVWETAGHPVNVGRAQRIVPDRTRRLVEDRDSGCRFPGCAARGYLEVHHIVHWHDGGPTDTWNLLCLCPYHHDAHHRGEFLISGDADHPDGVRFTDRRGNPITVGRARPPNAPLPRPPDGHRYQHPVGEPIQHRWVHFTPPTRQQTELAAAPSG